MFRLDDSSDSMANVFVYGIAIAADIFANNRMRLLNTFQSLVVLFYTNNYCTITV